MLAGVALAGVHVLLFVLCLDAAAVYFYLTKNHEYAEDEVDRKFNLFVVLITIGMDVFVALQFLYCMLYLCCSQIYKHYKYCICCCECCLPFTLAPYFYVIFGDKKEIGRWKLQDLSDAAENKLNLWVLTGTMVAPLFCVASHAGYILIAWVTEPAKTTAAFLVGLGSFLCLFFVFKQCYIVHKDAELEEDRQKKEQQQGQEEEEPSCCSKLLDLLYSGLGCFFSCIWSCWSCICSPLWSCICSLWTFSMHFCCNKRVCSLLGECCLEVKANHIFCCKKHWIAWFCLIFPIPLYSLYTLCVNSLYLCVRVGLCCSISKNDQSVHVSCCPICKKTN